MFRLLHFALCLVPFVLASCAAPIRSDVEAQVFLTQSALNRTATAQWQATQTAQDVIDSQVALANQQAEAQRLANEKALVELEAARRALDEETLSREMARQREQQEWEAQQAQTALLQNILVFGVGGLALVVVVIIGYQFFLFTDGVRQLQFSERYQKSQTEIWRLRADASKNLLAATEATRHRTRDGQELIWDYEAEHWKPVTAALPAPSAPPPASLETQWRMAAYHAGLWATQYGFGESAFKTENLVRDPATGLFWEDGRRKLMEMLDALGVTYARQGKARGWADGWGPERFERDYWHLPTPPLPNIAVPVVSIPLRSPEVGGISTKFRGSEVPALGD